MPLATAAVLSIAVPVAGRASTGAGGLTFSPAVQGLETATIQMSSDPAWPMHPVTADLRLANGLGSADVNGDGRADYATAEEADSSYRVIVRPRSVVPGGAWPSVRLQPAAGPTVHTVPSTVTQLGDDAEYAALADLDGDGHPDLIAAQGGENFEGYQPGVRIMWGPSPAHVQDPSAWLDGGRIPSTKDLGHFERVQAVDLNGDGAPDILAGGRALYTTGKNAGIGWAEAPTARAQRRDLGAWTWHSIDPSQVGGYGFAVTDVDHDGRPDIVLVNADQNTPDSAKQLVWYRNPGPGAVTRPWPKQVLVSAPTFDDKPQVAVGDLGDGRLSIVTETPTEFVVLTEVDVRPVRFSALVLRKPAPLAGLSPRMLTIGDVNGDGLPDVIAGNAHDGHATIPLEKAAAFWLSNRGGRWDAHVIRWGAGRVMYTSSLGEKWQSGQLVDLNGDGRPDLLADNQEWYIDGNGEIADWGTADRAAIKGVALVWFENRVGLPGYGCSEQHGRCLLEAEQPSAQLDGTWIERRDVPGGAGSYLQAFNGVDLAQECSWPITLPGYYDSVDPMCAKSAADGSLDVDATKGVRYEAHVSGGRYRLRARVYVPATWGNGSKLEIVTPPVPQMGAERSDSAWLLVDGKPYLLGDHLATGRWVWTQLPATLSLRAGMHHLDLRVRERGLAVDQLALERVGP